MFLTDELNHIFHFFRNDNFSNFVLPLCFSVFLIAINFRQNLHHDIVVHVHSLNVIEIMLIFNEHPVTNLFIHVHQIVFLRHVECEILHYLGVQGEEILLLVETSMRAVLADYRGHRILLKLLYLLFHN